jgi:hypothetical protein
MNAKRFGKIMIMIKTKTMCVQATPEGIKVQFEGLDGSKSRRDRPGHGGQLAARASAHA